MKTVYFVRHGEAENNIEQEVYQGVHAPLTDKGHDQARMIAARAALLPVEVLIASTVLRTQQTAEMISGKIGKGIMSSELFVERRAPSSLIGMRHDSAEAVRLHDAWEGSLFTPGKRILDGENFEDIKKRTADALSLLGDREESNILVVTHGFFLRAMTAYAIFGEVMTPAILRDFYFTLRTSNTGVTVFKKGPDGIRDDDAWRVLVWNDHSHLG